VVASVAPAAGEEVFKCVWAWAEPAKQNTTTARSAPVRLHCRSMGVLAKVGASI
jgi:hypothetical protein